LNRLRGGSAEREAISFRPRIEKLDLEESISYGLGLSDQLIEALFAKGAFALLVNVSSVSGARHLSIDEHAKWHRSSSRWGSHNEVNISRMEADRNPSGCFIEHCRVLGKRPDA
jgi:hypothetical protein